MLSDYQNKQLDVEYPFDMIIISDDTGNDFSKLLMNTLGISLLDCMDFDLQKLNEKERMIVVKRFFDGRTQMEVAEEIGISQAQVSRLEKNALHTMEEMMKS